MYRLQKIILICSLSVVSVAKAQPSSVSIFSPYTFYGIGVLATDATIAQRAMGGVGVADYDSVRINPRNVASYGRVARNTMLLDMGVAVMSCRQKCGNLRKVNNTVNLSNVSLVAPITKGVGLGLDIEPRSSVGYRVKFSSSRIDNSDIEQFAEQDVTYEYSGQGGVTKWSLGAGFCSGRDRRLSLGAELILLNCSITREGIARMSSLIEGKSDETTSVIKSETFVKLRVGVALQYDLFSLNGKRLTVGMQFVPRANVKMSTETEIATSLDTLPNFTEIQRVRLPAEWRIGIGWHNRQVALESDCEWQRWKKSFVGEAVSARIATENFFLWAVGVEFTPKFNDVRNYWNRVTYRVGFRYDNGYISDSGRRLRLRMVSLGIEMPMKQMSSCSLTLEYGRRGFESDLIIKENFLNFKIGLSLYGTDGWFRKLKYK